MTSLAYALLWLFVFSLPWEPILVIVPGVGLISKITGALALGSALAVTIVSGRVRRWHVFHVAALLFVTWLMCLMFVRRTEALPNSFWTFVQLFTVLWMIWELAPSWDRQIGLLTAYVFGAYVAALDTILVYRSAAGSMSRYASGDIDANDLAMTLALALPMAWYLGMTERRPLLRWASRAYFVTGLFAIGLTGSRGGMLATMVAVLIVPLTMLRLSPGRRAAAIGLVAITGTLAVAYIPGRVVQRLSTVGSEVEEGGISGRARIWRAGLIVFAQKPVAGYGPGGFRGAVRPYLGTGTQVAHNSYLSVLVEEGLIGFLFYATMIGAVWASVLKLPMLERRFALILLATLAVAMTPLTWEDRKQVWFILAALLGLSQAPWAGRAGMAGGVVPRGGVPAPASRAIPRTQRVISNTAGPGIAP
jgi:O-antigen ligase